MKFYVKKWKAVTNGLSISDDWLKWAKKQNKLVGDLVLEDNLIPVMLRRRCSIASKIALSLALPLINEKTKAGIFCSQHGELSNTVELFKQIHNKEILSPNKFSQCVHNTSSGLLSIQQKLNIPFNSISAGCETFQMGLIDAVAKLLERKEIIFVTFDEKPPEVYDSLNIQYSLDYGLALQISNEFEKDSIFLDIEINSTNTQRTELPPALVFLVWLLGDRKEALVLPTIKIKEIKS